MRPRTYYLPGNQRGLSLIELMVALLLGSILIAGAITTYLAAQRSYSEVERAIRLSDSGRFGLQLVNDTLRHIGFFAGLIGSDIDRDGNFTPIPLADDCASQGAAYDTSNYLFAMAADNNGDALGCITDAVANTDIIFIKSLIPNPHSDTDPDDPNAVGDGVISFPAGLDDQTTYVLANSEFGLLMDGADTPPSIEEGRQYARAVAWPYNLEIFYIRDNDIPTLARKTLQWDASASAVRIATQELVEGVENIRFRFGFDSNSDGEVDTFGNHTKVGTNWQNIGSIEVFMLIRDTTPDATYTNIKTYALADLSISPGDNFRRLMVQSSVSLRNPKLTIRGGR